jgi:hypothetical protein
MADGVLIAPGMGPIVTRMLGRQAGPNPAGSKLTDNERLRLLFLAITMKDNEGVDERAREYFRDLIWTFLADRGMGAVNITGIFEAAGTVLGAIDTIAVHPKLAAAVGRENNRG